MVPLAVSNEHSTKMIVYYTSVRKEVNCLFDIVLSFCAACPIVEGILSIRVYVDALLRPFQKLN